jgi:DNA-binding response OmpR family regulator
MTKAQKRPQVCIVDDNRIAREVLGEHLSSERYDLNFVESGKELLANLYLLKPDVILLDVMMPDMNGFEVCQHVKQQPEWQHIPIILVTALDSKDALVLGLDAGADEFLAKPVNGHELRSRVRSMLRIKKLYDELQATLELREELADMIANDMKASLNIIKIHNDLILYRHEQDNQALASLRTIQTQLRYLDSYMSELLLTTKIDEGIMVLNRSRVNVNERVRMVIQHYEELAESRGINFIVALPEKSRFVLLNADLFDGILDSLISYAFKVSPTASTITLRIGYPGEQNCSESNTPVVQIQVFDEGPHISQADWNSISDRFKLVDLRQGTAYYLDPSLIFCKLAVNAHGGHIYVTNNNRKGNILTVEF